MSQRQAIYRTEQEFGVLPGLSPDRVSLRLPIPPSANRYWRSANNRVYVSQEAQDYKQLVRLLCGQVDPLSGNVAVSFTVYRARKAGDLDNFVKVLIDSLRGILYPDDNVIVEIHATRKDDKENPRVMLTAWRCDGKFR